MKAIELNEHGLAVWRHLENKNLFAERAYRWVDHLTILNEKVDRRVEHTEKCSTFDFTDWVPVTPEEIARVKFSLKEIYGT